MQIQKPLGYQQWRMQDFRKGVPVASRRCEPHPLFVSAYPSLACDALLYLCKLLLLCVRVDLIGL